MDEKLMAVPRTAGGFLSLLVQRKKPKKARPGWRKDSLASAALGPALPRRDILSRRGRRRHPCLRPFGRSPKALRGSGAPYGVLKTPPREDRRWFAPIPVGASRAPPRDQGFSRASWSSPRRPGCEQGTGRSPAKRPGVFLFGSFHLDKQEKGTQGAGAEPPAISFSNRARSAHNIDSVGQPPTSYTSPKAIRQFHHDQSRFFPPLRDNDSP